jgi:hypothetical protein
VTGKDIRSLFDSAAEVLATANIMLKYEGWDDVIGASIVVEPQLPTTRGEAQPHVLLRGPFAGDPDLITVAFYVGIGLIEVRALTAERWTYETSVIGGNGIEKRDAFLMAARDLFFNDVKFQPEVRA